MTLRTKLALFRHTSWPLLGAFFVAAVAATSLFGVPFVPALVVGVVLFVATTRTVPGLLLRREYVRLARLMEMEDVAGARLVLGGIRDAYMGSASALERLRLTEASLFVLEGRHADACKLLESLDRKRLGPGWEVWLDNSLAWSMAHTGRVPEAVTRARASLELAAKLSDRNVVGEDLRAYQLGTLGAALVLSGEVEEAIPLLEQALARGGRPRAQAARAFYLGEALRGAGRDEDAAKVYAQAAKAAPANEFGKRAESSLRSLRPYR